MTEEMYDIVDEQGNKTGQTLPKTAVHQQGLRHGSVHVWILDGQGNILLQYRAANKKIFPSCWDTSVAGHVSAGDVPEDTALCEVQEEIGLTIEKSDLQLLGTFAGDLPWLPGGLHREFNTVFAVHKDFKLADLVIQQEELTDLKLVTADELQVMLKDPEKRRQLSGHTDKLFELAITAARK